MQLIFPRTNQAIHYTTEYYKIGRIVDYFKKFEGNQPIKMIPDTLDSWFDFTLSKHAEMESEINQVIYTNTHNAQVEFFEWIKGWLDDYRIESINRILILDEITSYNERAYIKFEETVLKKEEEFKKSDSFKRDHLEEYEKDMVDMFSLLSGRSSKSDYIPHKEKIINYRYYCITDRSDVIDPDYIDQYLPIVNKIVSSLKDIIGKYVDRYNRGLISSATQTITIERNVTHELLALPMPPTEPLPKIKWTKSAKEFVQTFNPMIRDGLLELNGNSDTDTIAKMLHKFFLIDKVKGEGELSVHSLATYFKKENSGDVY